MLFDQPIPVFDEKDQELERLGLKLNDSASLKNLARARLNLGVVEEKDP